MFLNCNWIIKLKIYSEFSSRMKYLLEKQCILLNNSSLYWVIENCMLFSLLFYVSTLVQCAKTIHFIEPCNIVRFIIISNYNYFILSWRKWYLVILIYPINGLNLCLKLFLKLQFFQTLHMNLFYLWYVFKL